MYMKVEWKQSNSRNPFPDFTMYQADKIVVSKDGSVFLGQDQATEIVLGVESVAYIMNEHGKTIQIVRGAEYQEWKASGPVRTAGD